MPAGIDDAEIGPAEPLYTAHRRSHFEGWTRSETAWGTLDSTAIARVAAELAAIGVTMVPTLVLHETWSRLDDPAITSDQDLAYVPSRAKEAWSLPDFIAGVGWDARNFGAFRSARAKQDLFLREFLTAGGNVVAGTDAARPMLIPGVSLHTELRLLVAAGLPPRSALQAATSRAAALIGADSIGDLYYLWSLERVAVAYDLELIGGKDWYRWGAEIIVKNQKADGGWSDVYHGIPDTCFALLFLKRTNVAQDLTGELRKLQNLIDRGAIRKKDD